jgi:hypothetical protein
MPSLVLQRGLPPKITQFRGAQNVGESCRAYPLPPGKLLNSEALSVIWALTYWAERGNLKIGQAPRGRQVQFDISGFRISNSGFVRFQIPLSYLTHPASCAIAPRGQAWTGGRIKRRPDGVVDQRLFSGSTTPSARDKDAARFFFLIAQPPLSRTCPGGEFEIGRVGVRPANWRVSLTGLGQDDQHV